MNDGYINRQKRRIDRLKEKMADGAKHIPFLDKMQHNFFWVFGLTPSGKKVTLGPFHNAGEADRRAAQLDDSEVYELPTRDRGRAVQMIRTKLLRQGERVDKALERQLSERGYSRERYKPGWVPRR